MPLFYDKMILIISSVYFFPCAKILVVVFQPVQNGGFGLEMGGYILPTVRRKQRENHKNMVGKCSPLQGGFPTAFSLGQNTMIVLTFGWSFWRIKRSDRVCDGIVFIKTLGRSGFFPSSDLFLLYSQKMLFSEKRYLCLHLFMRFVWAFWHLCWNNNPYPLSWERGDERPLWK